MRKETILLVNPNQMKPPVTPVALDYLAQSLEEEGFEVEVLDLAFSTDAELDIQSALRRMDPLLIGVTVRNLDDSYLASQDFCLERTRKIIDLIKSHSGAMLVLGGVGFSIAPEAVLDYCQVDWGICGEGEQALPILAQQKAKKGDFHNIPGLVFRDGTGFHRNPTRSFFLKDAALGRRKAIDNLRYLREGGMVGFESKRGCNQGCTFCADPIAKGKRVRLRNPSLVAEELANLYQQGIDHFIPATVSSIFPKTMRLRYASRSYRKGWETRSDGMPISVPSRSPKSSPTGCRKPDAWVLISEWIMPMRPC